MSSPGSCVTSDQRCMCHAAFLLGWEELRKFTPRGGQISTKLASISASRIQISPTSNLGPHGSRMLYYAAKMGAIKGDVCFKAAVALFRPRCRPVLFVSTQ